MDALTRSDAICLGADRSAPNPCLILQLPDELLAEISFQVVLSYAITAKARGAYRPPFESSKPRNVPPIYCYKWIVVAHICYQWRQVVLPCPFIWSTVAFPYNTVWTETLLERSQPYPLSIVADVITTADEEPRIKDIVLQLARQRDIMDLYVVLDPRTAYAILTALSRRSLATGVAHLESLDIKIWFDRDIPTEPMPVVPRSSLSRLRHLTFRCERTDRAEWDWEPEFKLVEQFLLPSLTTLHLLHLQTPISTRECLDILATLPRLEDLALGQVLKPFPYDARKSDMPRKVVSIDNLVILPNLRRIAFKGSTEWSYKVMSDFIWDEGLYAADVLRHLLFPSSADIFFSMGEEDGHRSQTFTFVCKVLRDTLSSALWPISVVGPPRPLATRCHITISRIPRDPFTCEFVVELFSAPEHSHKNKPIIPSMQANPHAMQYTLGRRILQAQFRVGYCDFADCISDFLDTFKPLLSQITIFHFKGTFVNIVLPELEQYDIDHDDLTDPIWESMAHVMPRLRELVVTGWHSAEFIKWLAKGSPISEENILPYLRRLEIDGSDPKWKNWDVDLPRLVRRAEETNTPVVIDDSKADDESMNGPRESLARQVLMALTVWSMRFIKLRTLPVLTVSNANVADQKDLDRLRACCFIDLIKILYATEQ